MYILSLTARQQQPSSPLKTLLVWVNCNNQQHACEQATQTLVTQGWHIEHIDSATITDVGDYFPPCASLDAFHRAEIEDVAYRIL